MPPEAIDNDMPVPISAGRRKRIMIVAGEASGDFHGANLVRSMLDRDPRIDFYGMGGSHMRSAGVELIADAGEVAVVGLTDVIARIGVIMGVMNSLRKKMKEARPDLLILIDYPGFNLRLAKSAKSLGIKVFYYITPKVWAWGKGRIKKIRDSVDKLGVIFPFEEKLFRDEGVDAVFVGHPLLDDVKRKYSTDDACRKFGVDEKQIKIALLPGSRRSEITLLLPEMLKAADTIGKKIPGAQFVLPLADSIPESMVAGIINQHPVKVSIVHHDTYDAIGISDLVIVASGTATLETALLEKPMIIVYKVSLLTYYVGRMFVRVENIGLPNIISGRLIVPELLQDDATADKIAAEALDILTDKRRRTAMYEDLAKIKMMLGESGAAGRAAGLALDMIGS